MLVCFRRFIGGIAILSACLLAIPSSADMQLYTVADLGTLPGATMGFTMYMTVSDINDAGDVVGCAGWFVEPVFGDEVWRPFVYANGEMRQMADRLGCAYGINDSGQATGFGVLWGQHDARGLLGRERRAEEHRRVAGILESAVRHRLRHQQRWHDRWRVEGRGDDLRERRDERLRPRLGALGWRDQRCGGHHRLPCHT